MNMSKYLARADQLSRSDHGDHETLLDDLQNLIDSAEEFLESTASYSGAEIEAARARVVSQLHSARAHTRHHRRTRVYRKASELAHTSGRYVSEHKWQSAGVFVAAAALVGGVYAGMKWNGRGRHRPW